jgi:UDP-glucose 4-epimerase
VTRGYPPPMRILVTGGAGYVGSVSVEALVEAGHEVVVLDNLSTGRRSADLLGAELVEGTYTESIRDPALYFRENLGGGVALLEAMRDVGVGRLVISSTAAVYGVPESSPIDEDASLRPINPYGESKRGLEAAAGWFARAYGLRAASLRYFNVAGASERNRTS